MKKKSAIAACIGLAMSVSSVAFANPDEQKAPVERPRRAGEGASDQPAGQDRAPEASRRFGNGRPGGPGPAQFVTMLMRQFDKDGDQKLDSQELTALLTSMRERQAQMGAQIGGQGPMGPMQANRFRTGGPAGMDGRRGAGDGNNEAGGVSPKRPPVEE